LFPSTSFSSVNISQKTAPRLKMSDAGVRFCSPLACSGDM
jgi:hypothetical protein